ncbi:ABC transporter substrate-binding protein [Rhodococcus sp. NCIMB 12038]|uniref:ABC transporter substrate-binding protein n=1 Tax=Rhodococcus sp. NCIMB 12038 TaxID=933800 RepID=UPI000B3C771E|nr:extracellular solute-binding protein [Rhodococcus sp. NCIMB 12038]OUS79654.1 hypothetical protein CA951_42505 [Rhodococcus sp. NCIMB 12038]
MRIKKYSVAAVVAAISVSLAACGGASGSKSTVDHISMAVQAGPGNQAAFDQAAGAFERETGIKVDVEYIGGDYRSVITARLRSGNAPDLLHLVPGSSVPNSVLPLAEAGFLAPATDHQWVGKIAPDVRNLVSKDGQVFAWPSSVQVSALYLNTKIFAEQGIEPPQTFADLLSACTRLDANGLVPVSWIGMPVTRNGSQATTISVATGAADISVVDAIASGAQTFQDSPQWRETLNMIVAMRDAKCMGADGAVADDQQAIADLSSGRSAMTISNSQQMGSFSVTDPERAGKFLAYPFPGQDRERSSVLVTPYDALAVNSKSSDEVKESAFKFIQFVASPQQQGAIAEKIGNLSPDQVTNAQLPDEMDPLRPLFEVGDITVNPVMRWSQAMYPEFSAGVQGLVTNQSAPSDILATLDRAEGK